MVMLAAGIGTTISCGYHVGGKADLMPKSVRTIAVPPFTSLSPRYTLVDAMPQAISREFSSRSRFVIVPKVQDADAVLTGTINSANVFPTIYDPASGKATSVQLLVNVAVKLVDQKSGKILYSRANWQIREDYELAVDPHQFFDESGPALDRVCGDVARDLVSGVLENF